MLINLVILMVANANTIYNATRKAGTLLEHMIAKVKDNALRMGCCVGQC